MNRLPPLSQDQIAQLYSQGLLKTDTLNSLQNQQDMADLNQFNQKIDSNPENFQELKAQDNSSGLDFGKIAAAGLQSASKGFQEKTRPVASAQNDINSQMGSLVDDYRNSPFAKYLLGK